MSQITRLVKPAEKALAAAYVLLMQEDIDGARRELDAVGFKVDYADGEPVFTTSAPLDYPFESPSIHDHPPVGGPYVAAFDAIKAEMLDVIANYDGGEGSEQDEENREATRKNLRELAEAVQIAGRLPAFLHSIAFRQTQARSAIEKYNDSLPEDVVPLRLFGAESGYSFEEELRDGVAPAMAVYEDELATAKAELERCRERLATYASTSESEE